MPGIKGKSGGHNRKTTAEHATDGTYRAHRHSSRADVRVTPSALDCPEDLGDIAKETWSGVVDSLPEELLTKVHVGSLRMYCETIEQYRHVWPLFCADPLDKDLRITAMALIDRADKLGRQFGWTPQALAGLRVPPSDKDEPDPMVEFLRGRRERNNN